MNDLTNLLKPLYNTHATLDKGIGKLKSIKIPSYGEVKSYVKENNYDIAALASVLTSLGVGVSSSIKHYLIDKPPTSFIDSPDFMLPAVLFMGAIALSYAGVSKRKTKMINELINKVAEQKEEIEELNKKLNE